jgi:O-antigen/teichoic acid export membrane protein
VSLSKTVIVNYLGFGWTALISLALVPLYVRILGIEAYALVGLFGVIMAWLGLLDLGMTATMSREMARFRGGALSVQEIRDLLRSVELLCGGVALAIAAVMLASSGFIVAHWLKLQSLPFPTAHQAMLMMSLVVALRFCETIYRSALVGLHRQIWLSAATALLATLRHGGVLPVIMFIDRSLSAFFIWQALVSLLTVFLFGYQVHRSIPSTSRRSRFSLAALNQVRGFAGGAFGITLMVLFLNQIDKVILSRMLPLDMFGYYMFAWSTVSVLYLVVTPIIQAVYPTMVSLVSRSEERSVARIYQSAAQLITATLLPLAVLFIVFAEPLILAWSGDVVLAREAAPLLRWLAVGSFLNGLTQLPYHLQLAHGWTALALRINGVAAVVLVPALLWVVPIEGAVGAAKLWAGFNLVYLIAIAGFTHRRVLSEEFWPWVAHAVMIPVAVVAALIPAAWALQPQNGSARLAWVGFLALIAIAAAAAAVFASPALRRRAMASLQRVARSADGA